MVARVCTCLKCGMETDHFRDGYCKSCYLKKNNTETPQTYADKLYHALKNAKETIHIWHNIGQSNPYDDTIWNLYQNSPEMKRINEILKEFE